MYHLRELISSALLSISGFVFAATWFSGFALHIYTIIFAFKVSGVLAAIISFFFPVISQVYWVWRTWNESGSLVNDYSYWVFTYIAWFIAAIILTIVGSLIAPKEINQ